MIVKILIFSIILLGTVNSVSVCPSGSISYDQFNALAEDVLRHRSNNFDVFYRMTYESGVFKLNCHRVTDQENTPNPQLEIQNISITGQRSWRIVAVSQRGSCVVVKQGSNLVAYNTFSGQFVQIQSVSISSFGKRKFEYSATDNCDIIRAIGTNSDGTVTTKVISNNIISDSTTYPVGSLFSYDFKYAVDKSSRFYISSSGTVTNRTISQLKSTPVYIKWSSKIQAVITVTSDANGYAIVVVDPKNNANLYTRTLVKGTDYNGTLKYFIRTAFASILLRDDNGYVDFIQLGLDSSSLLLTGTSHTFEDPAYAALFTSSGEGSISNDILFAYDGSKMSYFQANEGIIYYLGELATDIKTTAEEFRVQYSAKEINIVLALTAPTTLNFCFPIPNTVVTSSVSVSELQASSVVDSTTGQTLKCPDNCVTCESSEQCKICRIGYSLNEVTGKCIYCNGCMTCNPTKVEVCYLCFAPEILNRTSSECVLPKCTTQNCLQCDINGVCTKCMLNYGLINNQCQKCQNSGCRSCSTGIDTCDSNSCVLGYVYFFNIETGKGECQSCAAGCSVCLESDLSACSSCVSGFYPRIDASGVTRCAKCSANCVSCKSATQCTRCVTGYIPNADGSQCTLKCNANCLTCDQSNASKCLTCFAGSNLNSATNKCEIDLSCNSTSSCLVCEEGYVLNAGKCEQCSTTDENCVACLASSVSTCSECSSGFYLKDNKCSQCIQNCASCVGSDACYRCNAGYYLMSIDNILTGACEFCDPSCKTCEGTATTCTSCESGYTLEASRCISANRVIIEFVIQANVNNFIEFMDDLINWLISNINEGKAVGSEDITEQYLAMLKTEKYGSSVVQSVAGVSTPENANAIASSLTAAMNNNPTVNGYAILSGTAVAQTTGEGATTTTTIAGSSSSVGIIVGIVVPLVVILLVVTGIISYKVYKRREEKKKTETLETDAEKYSQKQFNYSESEEKVGGEKI